MTSKKIAVLVLVLVLVGLVLALSMGIISAPDVRDGSVMKPAVKNASVSPPVGNYTDSFNYSVDVRFYEEVEIELQIYHPIEGKFKPYEVRKYTGSRGWQTLWWNGTTFGPEWEGEDVKYCFSWKGANILFGEGPHINEELTWEFKNETVIPPSGYYNISFAYSVEFKSNKNQSITLEVYNFSSSKWETHETKRYPNSGNLDVLSWPGISHFASNDSEYVLGKYRFFFMDHGERYESNLFRDPLLLPTTPVVPPTPTLFKNATVVPSVGEYNTLYNYSVEIVNETEVNHSNVKLIVMNPYTMEEQKFENSTFVYSRLNWSIKPFENDIKCKGFARYYFKYNGNKWPESVPFYGPVINVTGPPGKDAPYASGGGGGGGSSYKPYMQYKNANVEPNDWTIKGAIESKTFYYSVEVDKKDMLILEIYNPSSNEWEEKGKGNESNLKGEWGKWRHEWNVTLMLDKNWAGYGKYRFYPDRWEKYASQVYYGPEIKMLSLSEWKEEIGFSDRALESPKINADVKPSVGKWFDEFTYTAEIEHPNKARMAVALFVNKTGINKEETVLWRGDQYNHIIEPSDYNDRNIETVTWTVKKSEVFDERDAGSNSSFYIWYWDGCNGYNKTQDGIEKGPMLLPNYEPEFTGHQSIDPQEGSGHCVYTYNFGINDTDDEIVSGLLTVVDPLNKTYTVEGIYERGDLTFVVGPSLNIFTDKKLQKYRDTSLFIWDKVPGEDSEKLKRYLVSDLGINWARNATLTKSSDNLTIRISTDNNSAEITMNEDMESATLGIDGAQNYILRVEKGFCWGDVPGEGNMKLIRFLKEEFDFDWAENANISKSPDNMTISIRKDESFATIRLDAKKEKAILEIGDGGHYELTVKEEVRKEEKVLTIYKMENSKLYIYPDSFTSSYRLRYWDEGMWVKGITKEIPEEKDSWWFGPLVRLVNVTFEEPKVTPNKGTYAEDFLYKVYLESSRENTIWLTLTIYDPANPEHSHLTLPEKEIKVLAANERSLARWDSEEIEPYLSKIFGPDDFGKTARYEIAWEDRYGSSGIKKGTGPSIERALPLLSFDQFPFWTIVVLPLLIFAGSLFFGLFGGKGGKGKK